MAEAKDAFRLQKIGFMIMGIRPLNKDSKFQVALNEVLFVISISTTAGWMISLGIGLVKYPEKAVIEKFFAMSVVFVGMMAVFYLVSMKWSAKSMEYVMTKLRDEGDTWLCAVAAKFERFWFGLFFALKMSSIMPTLVGLIVRAPKIKKMRPFLGANPYADSFSEYYLEYILFNLIAGSCNLITLQTVNSCYLRVATQLAYQADKLRRRFVNSSEVHAEGEDRYKAIVEEHIELLRITDLNQNNYKLIFYILPPLGIGGLLFNMMSITLFKSEQLGHIPLFVISQIAYLVALLVVCLSGEIVKMKFGELNFAIYCADWVKLSPRDKNSVKIIQAFTAKDKILTAARVFPLNFESFTVAMKSIYSFYTFLCDFA